MLAKLGSLNWCVHTIPPGQTANIPARRQTCLVAKPNLSLVDAGMTPEQAEALVRIWQAGAISYQTLYENLQRGELASVERSADDETKLSNLESRANPDDVALL